MRLNIALASFLLAALAALAAFPSVHTFAQSAGASLAFAPESGTYQVGKTFSVKVVLNSGGGVGVNAADGTVSFEPEYLNVTGVSKDGSIFSLWTSEPSYSNSNGTVTISGGSPSAFTRSGGTVVTITFRAVKAGTANLSFSSASVLAADGQGTNVLGETRKASFTLSAASAPPPPAAEPEESAGGTTTETATGSGFSFALDITSPTHPDPEKWYSNRGPEFKWKLPPDVSGVSATLTQNATQAAPQTSEGVLDGKKFDGMSDGAWYLHLRVKGATGSWSQTIHRKVLVDATPPDSFELEIRDEGRSQPPKAIVRTADAASGLDRFEVKIDDREPLTLGLDRWTDNTLTLPPILPGKHKVVVKAFDKAGNSAEGVRDFEIEGTAVPQITSSPSSVEEREFLIVEGRADRGARVILKIEGESKAGIEESVRADEDGKWTVVYRKSLKRGTYELAARQVTQMGAESNQSDKVALTVTPSPFIDRFGWILVGLLLFLLLSLLFLWYTERREYLRRREIARRETDEVKQKAEAIFAALNEEAEEKLQLLDENIAQKLGIAKISPSDALDKFRDALDISRDTLSKEIEDVEKALDQ